ncbi:odorant receptor 22c-like [Leptopilina boulardi]|uniref:odorant receptor 22c-like n=1 Tax=Leptopilina boulardi TaxID=63433 RepID=UPI0021F5B14F|nr:odorant receptor 22c-like [Leptopilina boulardi]
MYNRDFLKYFRINKFFLQFCGVMPFLTWGFFVNGIFMLMSICTCLFLTLPGFYIMISRLKIMATTKILNIFCDLIEILVVAFQVMLLLPKRRKLVNLVNLCNDLWENIKNKEEAEIVTGYASIALYLTYGFSINVFFALLALLIQPLLSEFIYNSNGTMIISKELPYSSGIFHENVQYFNIWYALQIPAGLWSIIPIIGIDTAIAFFVFHACAHFKLLQFQISKLNPINSDLKNNNNNNNLNNNTFVEIVRIIKQHQRVLNYSAAVEDVFSPVVLMQAILSITAICGFGFNFLMVNGGQNTATYAVHLIGGIFQLLIFCWPPNNLLFESMSIGFSAYNSPWYGWTKKERQLIEIITFRSQKFAYLSAGKFAYMSLQAFTSILSSAFSFFTLLRRVV